MRSLPLAISLATLLLGACSTQVQQPPAQDSVTLIEPTPTPAEPATEEIPARPFPADTLYSLIAAELAGSRERYDIALSNYLQQAYKTRDAGVAARATHIARYLNAKPAILNAATLWAELAPNDLEARFTAGNALAQDGRLLEAVEHAIYLQQQKGTSIFQSIAALAAESTDTQREQLQEKYRQLLQTYPDNTELLVGLGLLHQQQGETEEALEYAQQALKIEPKLIPAATLEARLLLTLGQTDKAMIRLEQMLEDHPRDQRLRLQYARLLAGIDLEGARKQFEIMLQQTPQDSELRYSLALIARELGDTEGARQHFTDLLQFPQRRSSAHYYLGRIAEDNQQWEEALEHYLLVEPGPDFVAALLHTTDILVKANEEAKAHLRLNAVRAKFPDQAERLFLLEAEVLTNHQRLQAAEIVLNQAIELFPTSTKLLYSRAMLHEQRGSLEGLEKDLRTVLKYDPNNATALNALGYTLVDRTDRIEEAEILITKAIQIRPDDAAIIDSMGWLHFKQGNLEQALVRLRQAMNLMPDHEIAAHLGEVLWLMGDKDQAESIWQRGLKLTPDSSIITETMDRLKAQ
ncbi:MAG: tetratricopeptide repeat protein [Candidatus Pelagadaptatus aseana]|uniref:tetratricopeptide repeat protein n=1 Tax=Candidatus Pelagadaptatus aseana TaxID=3120508 RepID=UPI0039B2C625